jgi:hypothetical protein
MPKVFSHVFNSDSKSVTFAWLALTIPGHIFFVLYPERFKVENWMAVQAMAAGLIGLKSAKEGWGGEAEKAAEPAAKVTP